MKKLPFYIIGTLALAACDSKQATANDYQNVQAELIKYQSAPILVTGPQGDYIIQVQETDLIEDIADKQKNSRFLSANPIPYITDETCLINVVPNTNCPYRIFCGEADDIGDQGYYAVAVCNTMQ